MEIVRDLAAGPPANNLSIPCLREPLAFHFYTPERKRSPQKEDVILVIIHYQNWSVIAPQTQKGAIFPSASPEGHRWVDALVKRLLATQVANAPRPP